MLKFNEQKQIEDINGALALRPQVEQIIDGLGEGFDAIYYLESAEPTRQRCKL